MLAALTGVLGGKHGTQNGMDLSQASRSAPVAVAVEVVDIQTDVANAVGQVDAREPLPSVVPGTPSVDAPTPEAIPEPLPATPLPRVEPAATSVPVVSGGIEETICAYPWDCGTALAIVRCESTFNPDAIGAGSYGLFQIQASVHAWKWPDFWQAWSDPVRNTEYAWEIYQGRGWNAWSCF